MQTSSDNREHEPNDLATSLKSLNLRISLGVHGILLPIIGLFATVVGVPGSAIWQSGEWTDKLSFALSAGCGWPILPFSIFAMVSMGRVILDETDAISKAWVRFGIFSGVFVCGWYLFALSSTVFDSPLSALGLLFFAAICLVVIHGWSLVETELATLISIIIAAAILAVMVVVIVIATAGIGWLLEIRLILSAPMAFIIYFGMSIRILMLHLPARRFTLSQLMAWVTWLVAFAAALQKTIALSFAKYSLLPLEPLSDDCYVATAASKGYPAIVGSQRIPATNNQPVIVNQQLATFKAAELTLRAISPTAHRWFRSIYNRLGPRAAAKLRGPLIATVAYLFLKPAEWLCRIVLQIFLGHSTYQLSKELYLSRAKVAGPTRKQAT